MTVAGLEAALLVGYAVSIGVVAITAGLSGPSAVSSPAGTVVEVVVFALFGLGMGAVARGRLRDQDWASVPFVVAQLLVLVAAVPMATGAGPGVPFGIIATVAAVAGLAALVIARTAAEPAPSDASVPAARQARRSDSSRP